MKIKKIFLKRGKKQILQNLSFEIKGKTALIGPNGAGKTTTLSIISQLIHPDKGEIIYKNHNILEEELFKEEIGVMIQNSNFDPDRKIKDEILLVEELKFHKSILHPEKLIENYGFKKEDSIKSLPHGKHKILLILQAFMGNPDIVLLDEPFSGLDIINRNIVKNIIKNYKGKILITTHLLNEIKDICEDVVFLKNGKVLKKEKLKKIKNLDKYYIKLYS